jgi:hypothetical protein
MTLEITLPVVVRAKHTPLLYNLSAMHGLWRELGFATTDIIIIFYQTIYLFIFLSHFEKSFGFFILDVFFF